MERIDTSSTPRFVLHVEAAELWLAEVLDAYPSGERGFRSPRDSEVQIGPDWSLASMAGDSAEAASRRQSLSLLLAAAQELDILESQTGIEIDLESGEDGFRFMVVSDALWADLTLVGNDMFFSDSQLTGAQGVIEFLMAAVNEGNAMLRALTQASVVVLAQFSTDPVLLTRLADYEDPLVRSLAVNNPAAPDEAKVLRALHDREDD